MPYPVKGVGEIKLQDEALFIARYAGVDGFLYEEDRVRDLPLIYESTLILRDDVIYVRLEASGQDFSDDFI